MPDLSSLTTNFFATPNEGFTTTTSGPVDSSSDTVVPFNSVSGLTNGSIFTGLIDPGNAKERAFTGVVDTGGSQITSVKFTTGTNATHTTGATIVDYVTGTHFGAMTKGIGISLDQDGTLKAGAVDVTGVLADSIVTKDKLSTAFELEHDSGWTLTNAGAAVPAPNTITNNGNRSYDMVFNSVDLTGYLSAGQRLRLTRTVSAPTQCADLESGSSQYFSSASAGLAGVTFTDDFVCSAWVRLESYGAVCQIASRYNGTSGWIFFIDQSGAVYMEGRNAGAVNLSRVNSYQSIPLNKWVHVVAQLDMSAFTATTTTSYVMIDGVDVPATVARGGTNPTALVQAGDLNIGAANATQFFDGKIAQVAIFSAKVTQATMRTYMSQGLSGSETSLVSAFSCSNSLLDLNTTNNNDLTANGGALMTNVDSPFGNYLGGTLEYGIITKTAFSTNTTLTVQVPEGCAIPTSGGVSAVAYSTQKAPYGMPVDVGRWDVLSVFGATSGTVSIGALNQWFSMNSQLTVPIGNWNLGYQMTVVFNGATNIQEGSLLLAPATPTNASRLYDLATSFYQANTAGTFVKQTFQKNANTSLSSSTAYLFYVDVITNSGATTAQIGGGFALSFIRASFNLL